MKYLAFLALAITGCAMQSPPQDTPPWLRMEPGYAEGCVRDGGCIPMSERELQQIMAIVAQKATQMCEKGRVSW